MTDALERLLDDIVADATAVRNELRDLAVLAWERATRGGEKVSGGTPSYHLDEVGLRKAKRQLEVLRRELAEYANDMHRLRVAVHGVFAGGFAEPTRGSWITKEEFREAIRRRRERVGLQDRATRADQELGLVSYEPHRTERQPNYPGEGVSD